MKTKTLYFYFFFLLILGIIAAVFSFPQEFNKGIRAFNSLPLVKDFKYKIPLLPNFEFKLGLDLQGGIRLLYQADVSKIEPKERDEAMTGLRDVIERRINLFGVKEPVVRAVKAGESFRLSVEIAGVINPEEAIQMIGQTPFLEFKEQRTEEEKQKILEKREEIKDKSPEEMQKIADWVLAFEDPEFKATNLTGRYLKSAQLGFDETTNEPLVFIEFNEEGAKLFEELTERNKGKPLAIYIDNNLISAPIVQDKISGGRAQISGNFTIQEAKKLANNLAAGALPLPITLISQEEVAPTLGKISLEKSLRAGFFGVLAIFVFMILYYRLSGLLASFSLLFYIFLTFAILKLGGVTMTLAGIGGFILSIGMAVDANILTFARLKEELAQGRDFLIALNNSFQRSWLAVRDSNLTTLMVVLVLFSFGTSFVKGFALTLGIGILVSIFSAMVFTRILMMLLANTRLKNYLKIWV